jgi:hypothetical protein
VIVSLGALVQIAFILTSDRLPGSIQDPGTALRVLASRLVMSPLIGTHLTFWFGTIGLPDVVAALVVLAFATLLVLTAGALSRPALIVMVYSAMTLAIIGIIRTRDPVAQLLAAFDGSRYFLLAGVAVMSIVVTGFIVGTTRQRMAATVLGGTLLIGVLFDFSIPTNFPVDWASASACIGGDEPCWVPRDGDTRWSIYWPGIP